MMVSANVGFLYTATLQFVGVLWMVTSRKFIRLLVSHSTVNLSVGCIVFKVCQYVLGVCVGGIINDQYVVHISEVFHYFVFVCQVWYVEFF